MASETNATSNISHSAEYSVLLSMKEHHQLKDVLTIEKGS